MEHIWKEILDSAVHWHMDTFKECTFESQLVKLEEELNELKDVIEAEGEGVDRYIEEVVDVLIVSYVLAIRFNSELGGFVFSEMEHNLISEYPVLAKRVKKALEDKMEINRNRIWVFENGKYHHVEVATNAVQ